MKTYQEKISRKFISFLFITVMLSFNFSFAAGPMSTVGERTKTMEVRGLDYYKGTFLTVLFVSARQAGFGTAGSRPRVRKVLQTIRNLHIEKGDISVKVPSAFVPRTGFSTYNYIIFAVHNVYNEKFILRNLDGSLPLGQDLTDLSEDQFKSKEIFSISKAKAMGLGNPIRLEFSPREKWFID